MSGVGSASVEVHSDGPNDLRFRERGEWRIGPEKKAIPFSNSWHWNRAAGQLTLAHERQGPDMPVQLLHFDLSSDSQLHCSQPHLCGDDTYDAVLEFTRDGLRITWTIDGPKKKDRIVYLYTVDSLSY